jgi:hypothetical protein
MNNVAVKYSSIIVWIVDYDYNTNSYIVEDKQGYKIKVEESALRFLTDK